ncbi:MAG: phosphoribosyltransferase family protein [Actinophytocola sp.]|uniref:orotate phosphoribosyltransferase n=1 Tax=Actinophytocola sp. TaxID=1872138 RepID=UPI003C78E816
MTISASLLTRIRDTACQRGAFQLPTGRMLDEYFDEYLLAADPALLYEVAAEIAHSVPIEIETLVGLDLGGIPLAVALSAATGVPAGFLRRERKTYGTCRQLEGKPVAGKRIAIVDDVVRSGSQVLRAASFLRQEGATVTTAVCVLDRELDGRARLANDQIALCSLLTPADLDTPSSIRQAS